MTGGNPMKIFKLPLALLLLAPAIAAAEPLPKPIAEMDRWVGQWKGSGTLHSGTEVAPLQAAWSCQRTSAKFGVSCAFHATGIPGVERYEETDLMGYDSIASVYHWYSVTNAGETHDHVARASSGDSLEFAFNGTQDGKPFKEVIDLTFADKGRRVTGRVETFVAGASVSVMELSMTK
jgi:hypothetical protein